MIGANTYAPRAIAAEARSSRIQTGHRILLGCLTLLLATAVVLQLLPYPKSAVVERSVPLADYFPREMAGWHGEDRPLAETEAAQGAVREIRNYDEAFLRFYKKDGQEFSLYVAYWQPGKMTSHEVAGHIPDKCWVAAGWRRTAADYHYQHAQAGLPLAPAQYREFELQNVRQYVIYWHMFNGRAIVYNPDGTPDKLSKLTDLFRRGLRQKGEQYFIRIASSTPLDRLWGDDGFQEILELVAPLGPGLHADVERLQDSP
jgi:hypothetical protein